MQIKIAGYIGAGHVDLAKVRIRSGEIDLYEHQSFVSRNFSSLEAILSLYLRKNEDEISDACFGVAGPVISNEVSPTNLPWLIIGQKLEASFSIDRVILVNDLVATAHGLSQLNSDRFFMINRGKTTANGNIGLIAAGTGLGEALIYSDGTKAYPYASEGGHSDFAPGSQIEVELWEYLYSENGQVEVEDVVSFSGLESIFSFLAEMESWPEVSWFEKAEDKAATIIEKALRGKSDKAVRALDLFIDCYASEAANLALKGMTLGGIHIGGEIAPQIITALDKGRFMERFTKKGKMESLLANMPVGIVIEDKTPLIGAAKIALDM